MSLPGQSASTGKQAAPKPSLGAAIVAAARKLLGDAYVYGGTGPKSFDCSGLVQYVLHEVGITMPRTSEAQWGAVTKISKSQLQPGDLVFSQWPGDGAAPGHVEIYIGGGKVLGADDPAVGVRVIPLSADSGHIVGYGRAPGVKGGGSAPGGGGGGFSLLSLALPADVLSMFSTAETLAQKLLWLVNPENWARIVAGFAGLFLAAFGLGFLVWSAV
ncbi:MAG TPA: NlpC/P60 family protein [Streptosporangiaceae bacterium]|nr:NlpC/P60 family protein [Streptosporangiaceae bacterium]